MLNKIALSVFAFAAFALTAAPAFAADEAAYGGFTDKGLVGFSAAMAIAIAALAGAFGQSKAAVAALEGMARNPSASGQLQTAMIIALALIESLVIYGLLIAFFLQGKVTL